MKKLMLYCGPVQEQPTEAFALLDEYAGLYGDNGGDPDGNTWLPNDQDDIPADLAQKIVDARLGDMVEVRMANDEAMYSFLGFVRENPDQEMDEETFETMRQAADDRLHWAHYGAYGAMDSHWVFEKPEE